MSQICTTLKKKRPTHNNWTFKNKLKFINTVLHTELGARTSGTNNLRSRYRLNHTTSPAQTLRKNNTNFQNSPRAGTKFNRWPAEYQILLSKKDFCLMATMVRAQV
ncbi:hypothetical protein BGZ89_011619 [Linnemannia elongata]|nr:hypothetical protein BGZ89_011619 [Linnemannia elongata]